MISSNQYGVLFEAICGSTSTGIDDEWIRLALSTGCFLFGSIDMGNSTGTTENETRVALSATIVFC